MNKEYGGFLQLELNSNEELYDENRYRLIRFNSVKASIDYIIKKTKPKKVILPYYYCPSTIEAIKQMCLVEFYHIDEHLNPLVELYDDKNDNTSTVIVLVNYFGVKYDAIKEFMKKLKKAIIIIDSAHGFFETPILCPRVYNVNSAKKFFGIPDGSYLISNELSLEEVEKKKNFTSVSEKYSGYLIKAYELGTNEAYQDKKKSDSIIAADYKGMSILAKGLLRNVDYDRVRKRRLTNFGALHHKLKSKNDFILSNMEYAAYHYPFMISDRILAIKVKSAIISEKIYAPTLWVGEDLMREGFDYEKSFADRIVFLPIDQRYDIDDMDYIAERVLHYIDEYT